MDKDFEKKGQVCDVCVFVCFGRLSGIVAEEIK